MVRKIKSKYINTIAENILNALGNFESQDDIVIDIKANLVSLFMIQFFSEYYKSDFFDKMLKIYFAG